MQLLFFAVSRAAKCIGSAQFFRMTESLKNQECCDKDGLFRSQDKDEDDVFGASVNMLVDELMNPFQHSALLRLRHSVISY